eukprot:2719429-Amphidinium_carterae.1
MLRFTGGVLVYERSHRREIVECDLIFCLVCVIDTEIETGVGGSGCSLADASISVALLTYDVAVINSAVQPRT